VNAACATSIPPDTATIALPAAAIPDASLPTDCTTNTANAASGSWLWAGRVQFSAYAQGQLGAAAVVKLKANPL
jgi:hypothetical protein